MMHYVVIHNVSFLNIYDNDTNIVETLLSHPKPQISCKYCLSQCNINNFLIEFEFKRKYLNYENKEIMYNMFMNIP